MKKSKQQKIDKRREIEASNTEPIVDEIFNTLSEDDKKLLNFPPTAMD